MCRIASLSYICNRNKQSTCCNVLTKLFAITVNVLSELVYFTHIFEKAVNCRLTF